MKRNRAWNGVGVAVIWSIWNQRNGVIFKERKVDAKENFSHSINTSMVLDEKKNNKL